MTRPQRSPYFPWLVVTLVVMTVMFGAAIVVSPWFLLAVAASWFVGHQLVHLDEDWRRQRVLDFAAIKYMTMGLVMRNVQ